MNALLSLDHDALRFSFPGLREGLFQRAEHHLQNHVERALAANPTTRAPSEQRKTFEKAARHIASDHTRLRAEASVAFQRTLRIPDDDTTYPLPPGLGTFPLRHVDDFSGKLPVSWRDRGGVMLPMHQSEALWLHFSSGYPVALKVGTGKICAVSGEPWHEGLTAAPQNYCALPEQPWLDGYAVDKDVIRQFVAQPLGAGFTVEEQLTGAAEWGGIQLQALPLDPDVYWHQTLRALVDSAWEERFHPGQRRETFFGGRFGAWDGQADLCCCSLSDSEMGLAPGGRMKQEIFEDQYQPSDYLESTGNRCFVHLCNSAQWELITGHAPPNRPPSARDYSQHGFPWFDYYDEKQSALPGGENLKAIKSVKQLENETGQNVLPENEEAKPKVIVKYIKD